MWRYVYRLYVSIEINKCLPGAYAHHSALALQLYCARNNELMLFFIIINVAIVRASRTGRARITIIPVASLSTYSAIVFTFFFYLLYAKRIIFIFIVSEWPKRINKFTFRMAYCAFYGDLLLRIYDKIPLSGKARKGKVLYLV